LKKSTSTRNLVGIAGVRDNIIITSDSRYVTVLEIDGVNFSLMNESEQDRVLLGFEKILILGEEFKFQIIRTTREINMEEEIEKLNILKNKNNICKKKKELVSDYLDFLLNMSIDVIVKRNYLIISYDRYCEDKKTFLQKLFKNKKLKFSRKREKDFKEANYMLSKVCKRLTNEYLNIGCKTKRLSYDEILDFLMSHYRPDYSNRMMI
jgi:hypothetical protein